ncbi:hypothetical protein ACFQ0B_80530 [Nonomuraea thailandensis]
MTAPLQIEAIRTPLVRVLQALDHRPCRFPILVAASDNDRVSGAHHVEQMRGCHPEQLHTPGTGHPQTAPFAADQGLIQRLAEQGAWGFVQRVGEAEHLQGDRQVKAVDTIDRQDRHSMHGQKLSTIGILVTGSPTNTAER